MTTHDGSQISRTTAEHLLDGGTTGAGPLAALLRAAAAPATEAELASQNHALHAFRAAHLARPQTPWRPRMLKTTIAQLIATKFATTAAVAVAATGGVALAAATGALPAPGNHHEARPVAASTTGHTAPDVDETDSSTPTASDSATSADPEASSSATESAGTSVSATQSTSHTPSPDLSGLCKAYQARGTHQAGNAEHSAAFTVLITAAGGEDNVSSYCVTLVGEPRTRPTTEPSDDGTDETNEPTAEPSHGRNEPSSEPTHPSGKPSESSSGSSDSDRHSSSSPTGETTATTSEPSAPSTATTPAPSGSSHDGHGTSGH